MKKASLTCQPFYAKKNPTNPMDEQTLICPTCGARIPLSETLTRQLRVDLQKEYEAQLSREKKDWQDKEKAKLWLIAQQKAKEKIELDLKDRENQLLEQKRHIEELEKKELDLRREKRQLEEERKKIELEVVRRVDAARQETIAALKKNQEEEYRLKLLEKDKQLEMSKRTVDELKRKLEQGSMQIQGEVQEMDLRQTLRFNFPVDLIQDVPTGIRGADLIQTVNNQFGQKTGVILWESKNTKAFSHEWVTKLKDDRGRAQADICVLVSQAIPKEINHFGILDGVWVTEPRYLVPLTHALRAQLIAISTVKQSLVSSDKKMEYLYNYLLSSGFRHKIENIIASFSSLKAELEVEKRAMQRIWSRREKEIERVVANTSSFYGDLQGVIGDSLPQISQLELPEGEDRFPS